ncbi:hypothetical protein F511_44488 [Dorcoceras hygrometricum]|uniref:Uncharacterized protein n=1 Tax=Dorcoceras hygrometricum TaxID=472368 RepID=A0A2Z7A5D3_9LAMI|nr:hypothetical protein F511_44488 [Dorcoceras hygrometricum]
MNKLSINLQDLNRYSQLVPQNNNTAMITVQEVVREGHTRESGTHDPLKSRYLQLCFKQTKDIQVMFLTHLLNTSVFKRLVEAPYVPRSKLHRETEASSGSPALRNP